MRSRIVGAAAARAAARAAAAAWLIAFLGAVPQAHAVYFASSTNGTSQGSGLALGLQFLGVRFTVTQPVNVDRIGGQFATLSPNVGNGKLFGAIVQLSGPTDVPDSLDLSTADVLASTTFTPPVLPADLALPIAPLTLNNGTYGVLFGSGPFGTSGEGIMPQGGTDIGSPSYFWREWNPTQWRNDATQPVRLTVYAVGDPPVPEPTGALALLVAGAPALLRRRRRCWRRRWRR